VSERVNNGKYENNWDIKIAIILHPACSVEWAPSRWLVDCYLEATQHGGVICQFRLPQAERMLRALESCHVQTNNGSSRFPSRHAKFLLPPLCHFSTLPDTPLTHRADYSSELAPSFKRHGFSVLPWQLLYQEPDIWVLGTLYNVYIACSLNYCQCRMELRVLKIKETWSYVSKVSKGVKHVDNKIESKYVSNFGKN
jgi:hypothetical protein